MSSILKLRILGVRAFDNHEAQELEFSSPLTLICGQNGVGKTTVIECLRYVTTGDLPPNAKGGAFIHDPRMSSEGEVKAQVKLLFRNSAGHRMVAARNMRLSVTGRGTSTFKTLEGYIKVQDKALGDTGSVSSRCADLNIQIPLALGVSPAILNYVVFCHQEDSLWPLAEPSIVKRRFDEIFEATKYTKALESLKLIRKDYVSNIKVEKVEVDHLQTDKERVREKHDLLHELQMSTEQLQHDCDSLQEERVTKSAELDTVVVHSQRVQKLTYESEELKRRSEHIGQSMELLKADIRELLDSKTKENISEELKNSHERESQLDAELGELHEQKTSLHSQSDDLQRALASIANQRGRIEQLQDEHNSRLRHREELAENGDHAKWYSDRNQELVELNAEIETLEIDHRKHEEKLMQTVSTVEAKRLQIREKIKNFNDSLRNYDAQAKEIRGQITHFNADSAAHNHENSREEAFALIKSRLAQLESEKAEADKNLSDFESKSPLQSAIASVRAAEQDAENARTQVQEAIDVSSARSRLQFLQASLQEAQTRLQNVEDKTKACLKDEKVDYEHKGQADTVKIVRNAADNLLKDLEQAATSSSRQLDEINLQVERNKETLEACTKKLEELESSKTELINELGDRDLLYQYDEKIQSAESELLAATEENEQLQFAYSYFEKALSLAQRKDHPICLLCDHEKTPREASALSTKLVARISALKVSPEEANATIESKREHLSKLRAQKPIVEKIRQVMSELAVLEKEATTYRMRLEQANTDQEPAKAVFEKSKARCSRVGPSLRGFISQLDRCMDECADLARKVDMETSISQSPETKAVQTPQEAQKDLETKESRLKIERIALDRARSEHERLLSRVSHLSHSAQELKLQLREEELKEERRKQAEHALSEVMDNVQRLRTEIDEAEAEIPKVDAEIDQAQKELRDKKHEYARAELHYAEERSSLVQKLKAYNVLCEEINNFETTHGKDPLSRFQKESEEARTKLQGITGKLSTLEENISSVENQRTDFGSYRRNLVDNLRLRNLGDDYNEISTESKRASLELEKARNEIGEDYEQKIRSLQNSIGLLNHQISTKTGESRALMQQMEQIRHELKTSYRETEEQYRRAVAKLETSQGAAEDLVKYVKALDAAIMQYHSLKMSEINSLLDEMWKRTYTGTDIDTILIRSESDAGSASTRANYNYRVCMVKQDTELDMRGRCSAGQKVLASILIRMALAECFGSSSGLIVLDEPTTNLDRDNIEALAQSLSDIIASRRAQKNFQLIVITHDEHFLAQMNPASYCSYYYRIVRDQRQLSKIQKMPITSLN